ncbi:MAG: hypothetical protein IKJ58_01845 [Akkermansia sp.]|nr:hypothetical protein [Akkermansia sp.]
MIHMRAFSPIEEARLAILTQKSVSYTLVHITATGFQKSILDATDPMREYFLENNIHNYEQQKQGTANKVQVKSKILTNKEEVHTVTSFYRPETKKGDPRLWVYDVKKYCFPDDILALTYFEDCLYVLNITQSDIIADLDSPIANPIKELICEIEEKSTSVANELLAKFQIFANEWIKIDVEADTGIGRTIERLLGIPMNSTNEPDYKGIELKSARPKTTRTTLFSKTPDWTISACKSSQDILAKCGYITAEGRLSYRNTLVCNIPNSQGLFLYLNGIEDYLEIKQKQVQIDYDIAVWRLKTLHDTLKKKHAETFWISTNTRKQHGYTEFQISKITHSRKPIITQFDYMLEQRKISVDLLLGREKHGDTYAFKLKKGGVPLLFPEPRIYTISR